MNNPRTCVRLSSLILYVHLSVCLSICTQSLVQSFKSFKFGPKQWAPSLVKKCESCREWWKHPKNCQFPSSSSSSHFVLNLARKSVCLWKVELCVFKRHKVMNEQVIFLVHCLQKWVCNVSVSRGGWVSCVSFVFFSLSNHVTTELRSSANLSPLKYHKLQSQHTWRKLLDDLSVQSKNQITHENYSNHLHWWHYQVV